jgi:hypothetical protein
LIIPELPELKTKLSGLRENITPEAAERLADKAHILFLESGEPQRAINSIREKFATVLRRGPMASDEVSERGLSVNETSFLGKDGSRSEFSTVISMLVDALRLHYYTPTIGYGDMYPATAYGDMYPTTGYGDVYPTTGFGMYRMAPEISSHPGMPLSYRESQELSHRIRVSQRNVTQLKIPGQHLFNVTWSAEETQEGKLGNLVVEDIEYETTIWKEP